MFNEKRAYNTAYARYIRRVAATEARHPGKAREIDANFLVLCHIYAKKHVDAMAKAAVKTCPRCSGTGLTIFTWKQAGICFECWGSGDTNHPFPEPQQARAIA